MNPINKAKTRIHNLNELLKMAIRIGEPAYIRGIRKDIEMSERELRILTLRTGPIHNED